MLVYVTAIFAWFAFVLLGVVVLVLLEPAWNPQARLARAAVGCRQRRARRAREAP
jgi:hypothetical protein